MSETTDAAVVTPIQGTTVFGAQGLNLPTPEWVRMIVRALTWLTGFWGVATMAFNFRDFGIDEAAEVKMLRIAAGVTTLVSILARAFGVKPVSLTESRSNDA